MKHGVLLQHNVHGGIKYIKIILAIIQGIYIIVCLMTSKQTNTTTMIRLNLKKLTNGICNRNTPRSMKMEVLGNTLNYTRYTFIGFDNNGSTVKLIPRYHNNRDSKGRFVSNKANKK
jgi:hypothetical protein